MSDTPRTDAECIRFARVMIEWKTPPYRCETTELLPAGFARELERELATAKAENARLREALQWFCDRVDRGEVRSKRSYAKFEELYDTPFNVLGTYTAHHGGEMTKRLPKWVEQIGYGPWDQDGNLLVSGEEWRRLCDALRQQDGNATEGETHD